MRDIFVFTLIISVVIATLRKPQIGILGWLWLSIMNPHKESYGWIYSLPILDIMAGATLISVIINSKQARKASLHPIAVMILTFYLWTCFSTIFAASFDLSFPKWLEFSKNMMFVLLMLLFLNRKHWIIAAIFVYVLSVGLSSVKGGIFTAATGGGARVWGAPNTAWGENNDLALAIITVIPLMYATNIFFQKKIYRLGVYGSTFLSFLCILGTQSRGGFVGIVAVSVAFFFRTKHKIVIGAILFAFGLGVIAFMPSSWKERMETIQTYEQDNSANSRIIQWRYAVQLSFESPILGNGFHARFYQPYYYKYMAGIDKNRAVHSNYFQILEEQGYVGLFIYLLLMLSAVIYANRISKRARGRDDLKWASTCLYYLQFSIIGYAFNGLTLTQGYLDLYYYLLAIIVLLISHITVELAKPDNKAIPQE